MKDFLKNIDWSKLADRAGIVVLTVLLNQAGVNCETSHQIIQAVQSSAK